ncbi:hypothetical protein PCASD_12577 [Puccinia coronata f. sp. avenae]|uniref:Uncharacterized protein n=1 Tax=Puccinia coronata f. sp. avenae TaxID=200324 RepID=A0A2N5UM16_9BASI|nr:hypothetical protein PCASD_12577 [Puccinia coronata f. sp. avenae]
MCAKSPELFELVITLGEDGTVLFASWFFQRIVPPIIPAALGIEKRGEPKQALYPGVWRAATGSVLPRPTPVENNQHPRRCNS